MAAEVKWCGGSEVSEVKQRRTGNTHGGCSSMSSSCSSSPSRKLLGGVIVALLSLYLLYFAGSGSFPLTDADETVYGQVAKEMAGGDWLTPHYLGQPWFDKPPLCYWLMAASTTVWGPNELSARLPSALMAVALLLLVYALTAFDFGRRAGLLAAVVMATCFQQIILAHAAVTDMTLAVTLLGALYGVRRWLAAAEGRSRLGWALWAGAFVGLATLTKGPVAMVLVGLALLVHLALTRQLGRLLSPDAGAAVLAALLVAGPWYATMYWLHGDQFVQGFLVANNLTRFLKAEHVEWTGGWYSYFVNIPVLLLYFLPWSVFLPQAVARLGRANEGARLAVTWSAVIFVFFSLSKTVLVTYIFPVFPTAALLVGAWWGQREEGRPGEERGLRGGLWVDAAIGVLLLAGVLLVGRKYQPETLAQGAMLPAILLVAVVVALLGVRRHGGRALGAIPVGMVVFTCWLVFAIMPLASPWVTLKPLLDRLPSDSRARVVSFGCRYASLDYYGGGRVEYVDEAESVKQLLSGPGTVFVICRQREEQAIRTSSTTVWAKSGRWELLTNRPSVSPRPGE